MKINPSQKRLIPADTAGLTALSGREHLKIIYYFHMVGTGLVTSVLPGDISIWDLPLVFSSIFVRERLFYTFLLSSPSFIFSVVDIPSLIEDIRICFHFSFSILMSGFLIWVCSSFWFPILQQGFHWILIFQFILKIRTWPRACNWCAWWWSLHQWSFLLSQGDTNMSFHWGLWVFRLPPFLEAPYIWISIHLKLNKGNKLEGWLFGMQCFII